MNFQTLASELERYRREIRSAHRRINGIMVGSLLAWGFVGLATWGVPVAGAFLSQNEAALQIRSEDGAGMEVTRLTINTSTVTDTVANITMSDARLAHDGNLALRLDADNNGANHKLSIERGDGVEVMALTEQGRMDVKGGTSLGAGSAAIQGTNSSGSAAGSVYGVSGVADGIGGAIHAGLYGKASGGGTNWAGYLDGDTKIIGALSMGTANTRFSLQQVYGKGLLFSHPQAAGARLSFESTGTPVMTLENTTGVIWDLAITSASNGSAWGRTAGGVVVRDTRSAAMADSWYASAAQSPAGGSPGPGFVLFGSSYNNTGADDGIHGMVLYWW
jgi:hypothetical protein